MAKRKTYARTGKGWKALALILAGVLILGAAYGIGYGITGKTNPIDWLKKGEQPLPDSDVQDLRIELTAIAGGSLVSDSAVSAELLDTPMALSSSGDVMTVTATVKHADGSEVSDYYQTVIFEGVGSDFDSYFNLTVKGNTATVTCKQAFDGTRELKCTSAFSSEVSNTVTMTYARRPESMGVNFGEYDGGTATGLTFYTRDIANTATLKLSDKASVSNSDWNTARIKLLNSIELGKGSTFNQFNTYTITVSIPDELKSQLKSNLSTLLGGDNWGTYTINYQGQNASSEFSSNKVEALTQYNLFDGIFGGKMGDIVMYSNGQAMATFMDTLIRYSQTGGYNNGTTALFNVAVEVNYKYGGTSTCNYEIYADFCDVSQITFNDSNHIF